MAKGSRRSSPMAFSAAAVPSEATVEAMNTPCAQSRASLTSGTAAAPRPPHRMAGGGHEHAGRPVAGLVDQRHGAGAPAAEQDGRDRHAGRVLPLAGDHRAL